MWEEINSVRYHDLRAMGGGSTQAKNSLSKGSIMKAGGATWSLPLTSVPVLLGSVPLGTDLETRIEWFPKKHLSRVTGK